MSVSEYHDHSTSSKKRVSKACDSCRLKKTKCNGKQPCERCSLNNKICVYTERKKSKEKNYTAEYVELMDNRLTMANKSLIKLCELIKLNNLEEIANLASRLDYNESDNLNPISINQAIELINDINVEKKSSSNPSPEVKSAIKYPIFSSDSSESVLSPPNLDISSSDEMNSYNKMYNNDLNVQLQHLNSNPSPVKEYDPSVLGFATGSLGDNPTDTNSCNSCDHNSSLLKNFSYNQSFDNSINPLLIPTDSFTSVSEFSSMSNQISYTQYSEFVSPSSITSATSDLIFSNFEDNRPITNNATHHRSSISNGSIRKVCHHNKGPQIGSRSPKSLNGQNSSKLILGSTSSIPLPVRYEVTESL